MKTDGLAAGKGVLVTSSIEEAVDDVRSKLSGRAFGDAGRRVVIEEGLRGPEVSLLCLADGRTVVPLASAQDYKRVGAGDVGPNTGGMGAYSPVEAVGPERAEELAVELVQPTLDELRRRGVEYRGVLYAGLMLTATGPKVLEFNVRFGDPEAQVVLPRLDSDLAVLLHDVAAGGLRSAPRSVTTRRDRRVRDRGLSATPRSGDVIHGLDRGPRRRRREHLLCRCRPGLAGRARHVGRAGPERDCPRRHPRSSTSTPTQAVGCLAWSGMVVRSDIPRADRGAPSRPG